MFPKPEALPIALTSRAPLMPCQHLPNASREGPVSWEAEFSPAVARKARQASPPLHKLDFLFCFTPRSLPAPEKVGSDAQQCSLTASTRLVSHPVLLCSPKKHILIFGSLCPSEARQLHSPQALPGLRAAINMIQTQYKQGVQRAHTQTTTGARAALKSDEFRAALGIK